MSVRLLAGDCRDVLPSLAADSVQCCVCSPPYYALRSYLPDGHADKHREIGSEATPDEYLATMVAVFREVRRVMRPDATCWVNLGDNFANKQLQMMPARVALALQADGWILRSDIIWCLSGGTRVYARTQKGEMPMTIKDMVRLDPDTVQLWNGEKWTQVLGWNRVERPETTYEIELRSGQRIGCTADHQWPTQRGNVRTDQLRPVGELFEPDVIQTCRLPEPTSPRQPAALDDEMIGWFVGLYIAEGSQSDGTIQIASHIKEDERFSQLDRIALAFHGTARLHKTSENGCTINLNGPMLNGLVDTYVTGRIAKDKHLHPRCWQRSDRFLRAVLDGYLSGDGHWHEASQRWRLGFCNNDELVADLRAMAARLGVSIHLKRHLHKIGEREFPGYKGDLRLDGSPKRRMPDGQVIAIRESRAREFWHLGVEDDPHLFSLSSGVLTSNSKPNPMPESVTDRCVSAHEHIFMLTKSARYFFDSVAIAEVAAQPFGAPRLTGQHKADADGFTTNGHGNSSLGSNQGAATRACRNVWTLATEGFSGAHFATFPSALAERCIRAGTSERGACSQCGAPWGRVTEQELHRPPTGGTTNGKGPRFNLPRVVETTTTGWAPSCRCDTTETRPCVVLDPFFGAGTTGLVSERLGRDCIGIDLNPDYNAMSRARIEADCPLFTSFPPAETDAQDERMKDLFRDAAD